MDSSWRRLSVQQLGTGRDAWLIVQWEGYSQRSALASPDVVWQAMFIGELNMVAICSSATNALAGKAGVQSGISDGAGNWLATFRLARSRGVVIESLREAPPAPPARRPPPPPPRRPPPPPPARVTVTSSASHTCLGEQQTCCISIPCARSP
jgi:hypothetical protein